MSGKINIRWHEFIPDGGARECFCSAEAEPGEFSDFAGELAALWKTYNAKLAAEGLARLGLHERVISPGYAAFGHELRIDLDESRLVGIKGCVLLQYIDDGHSVSSVYMFVFLFDI